MNARHPGVYHDSGCCDGPALLRCAEKPVGADYWQKNEHYPVRRCYDTLKITGKAAARTGVVMLGSDDDAGGCMHTIKAG